MSRRAQIDGSIAFAHFGNVSTTVYLDDDLTVNGLSLGAGASAGAGDAFLSIAAGAGLYLGVHDASRASPCADAVSLADLAASPSTAPTATPTTTFSPTTAAPTPAPTWADWETLPSLPVQRMYMCHGGGVANVGGYDVAVGGGTNGGYWDDWYGYTAATSAWTALPPMPVATGLGSCITYENELFFFGGEAPSAGGQQDTLYSFDGTTWSQLPPMTRQHYRGMTGAVGSKLYLAGGYSGAEGALDTIIAYDIATSTYDEALPPMQYARYSGLGVTAGSTIYILGGAPALDYVEAFTVSTSTWAVLSPMPEGAVYPVGAYLPVSGSIFAGATTPESQPLYEYSIATSTWSDPSLPSLPIDAAYGSFGFDGSKLYVIGGGYPAITSEMNSIQLSFGSLPTAVPTTVPTPLPSALPSPLPSSYPTYLPTPLPSALPSPLPSSLPNISADAAAERAAESAAVVAPDAAANAAAERAAEPAAFVAPDAAADVAAERAADAAANDRTDPGALARLRRRGRVQCLHRLLGL